MTTLAGTSLLLRHALHRDRVVVPVCVAALVLMTYASASATATLFGDVDERVQVARTLNAQPGLRALYGPILDPTSTGELAMSKLTVLYALISSVLYVVLVRRHTRVEEESGRAELVASSAVGRNSPMAAATVESGLVAVVLGVLVGVANVVGGLPVRGSVWFALAWVGTGLVATAVTAVACQLSASARTCAALASAGLIFFFLVRAVGDAVDGLSWLSWLSPLGWNTQLRAWSGPRWWVALLYPVLTVALLVAAEVLRNRRDLASGILAARPGRTEGKLSGAWSLTFRLNRTNLVIWTVGVAVMGGLFGALVPGFDDLLRGTAGQEMVARLGGTFIAALLSVSALMVTCFPVAVLSSTHGEENAGRAELVLATATSRDRHLAAATAAAAGGAVWLLLLTGATMSLGYALAGGVDADAAIRGSLGWLTPVLTVTAVALLGTALGVSWLGWSALLLSVLLTLVGELLRFPVWLQELSPFSAVPTYPAEPWSWTPHVLLGLLTLGITTVAFWCFARRDLTA